MTTITIAADGTGNYTAPNSDAYDALSTGTTANIVYWKPGVYRPTGGRWWGKGASRAMDLRVAHAVQGDGLVLLDGRIYVPLTSSASVAWHAASGTWRIELYTCTGGGTVGTIGDVWFGAETGDAVSALVMGDSYRPASSLANCNGDGLTVAGQAAGKGIWFPATETSTVDGSSAQVIYVWCPQDDAALPAVQWGGIAAIAYQTGATSAGTPKNGAMCFARQTSASANDPSGSSVGAGFVLVGTGTAHIGSAARTDADPSLPISDLIYDGVIMRGWVQQAMLVASDQAGTTYTNIRLEGDWLADDHRDPVTYGEFTDVGDRPVIHIQDRAGSIEIDGGSISVGNTHGALQIAGGAASGEARIDGVTVVNTVLLAKPGVYKSRWANASDCDDVTIGRCNAAGFNRGSQISGTRTLVHGCRITDWRLCDEADGSRAPIHLYIGNEIDQSLISVRYYANLIDLRGTDESLVWSAFYLKVFATDVGPAGAFVARDNVCLLGATQAPVRQYVAAGGSISSNQTWLGGFTNSSIEAYSSTTFGSVGSSVALSTLFAAGTTAAPTVDTAANIRARGDTPIRRDTAIS